MRAFEISVVLVRPIYENNVGASSRGMANMGATRLILIDKKCELTYSAQQAAASGQNGLQNRTEYKSWDEFFKSEPDGIRIAFTARDGRGRAVRDFSETLKWLKENETRLQKNDDTPVPVYLIFGPEDWGLAASDLEFVHFCCSIPTYGDNTSLNLAQAVLLGLFILRSEWGGQKAKLEGQQTRKKPPANVFPDQSMKNWLQAMGFDLQAQRKINVYTVLRRMLLQNVPTPKEYRVLETVLQQSTRKLNELKALKKNPAQEPETF